MTGQIVPTEDRLAEFKKGITSQKAMAAIADALPEHLNAKKMARVVMTAVTRTPKLLDCNPLTVMNAVIEASQLGLMPDGVLGHGYLVPYKTTCVFIPGYKGLLDLARRSGEIAWIQARLVYENDEFNYQYGMDPGLDHVPARASGGVPGVMIAAYGVAKFKSGEFHFEVMHKDQIEAIRQRSRAKDDGPWITDYDEMARKTVIRRLCKFLPMNPEYQALVTRDEYHEAGVLEKYIEVDPETGEVTETTPTGSMLDMFASNLETATEAAKAVDEAVESTTSYEPPMPDDVPPPGDDDKPPQTAPKAEAPPPVPDEGLTQGKGRISTDEDIAFMGTLTKLRLRMEKVADKELIDKTINNRLGVFGAEKPQEIRARSEREKFYTELLQMCELWEAHHRKPLDE